MYFVEIMDRVILSSEEMRGSKEVPIVAAIAIDKEIVCITRNAVESSNLPWMHAEFVAVQESLRMLNTRYLEMASIYVNLEPCAFCSALLEKVRIRDIFFGAYDPKGGAIEHNARIFDHSVHKPNIVGGIQETRASNVIIDFFKGLRNDAQRIQNK